MEYLQFLGAALLAVAVSAGHLGGPGDYNSQSSFGQSGVSSSYGPPSAGGYDGAGVSNSYGAPAAGYGGDGGSGGNGGHGGYEQPKSYEFGYAVRDYATGNDYHRHETSDGNVVQGEYRVYLPDGRTQIVSYTADWQNGYRARVTYEGEAQYPQQGYNQGGGYNEGGDYNQGGGYNQGGDYNQGSGYNQGGGQDSYNQQGGVSSSYGPPGYHK